MNIRSVDLNLIVAFDAFMSERNVTRAGQRLGLSQSAASGALARLRTMFDDRLFVRGPGGIVPTDKAERLIGPLRSALATLEEALRMDTAFEPSTSARKFQIAMSEPLTLTLLPRLLEYCEKHAPHSTLRVMRWEGHDIAQALEQGAELAVGVIRKPPSGYHRMTLLEEEMVCLVRRDHRLTQGRLTPKRFAEQMHMLVSARGKDRGRMDGVLEKLSLQRKVASVVPNWSSAALVLTRTDHLLTGPRSIAESLVQTHDLAILELPPALKASAVVSCGWHGRLDDEHAHRWLRDVLVQISLA